MRKMKQSPIVKKLGFNRIMLFLVMVLIYVIFCVLIPNFFGPSHVMSMLNYACFLGFLALGVTFVIATGHVLLCAGFRLCDESVWTADGGGVGHVYSRRNAVRCI